MFGEEFELIVDEESSGKRLDVYISNEFEDFSRAYIQKLIKENFIKIENNKKLKAGYKVSEGEKIIINTPPEKELDLVPQDIDIDIVYQDSDIVIVNKTPGIVVHPAVGNSDGTLVNALLYHIKDLSNINGVIRPGIVHRLDKNTSGLIIIAKNDNVHKKLVDMFKEKEIKKTYLAIVKGKPKSQEGRIETLIGRNPNDRKKMAVVTRNGKKAISNYKVLYSNGDYSFVKVNIETGRTHQIRVHMKYLNHPIVGDEVYGKPSKLATRQMLHAYMLGFKHPATGETMNVSGELQEDFLRCLRGIGVDEKLQEEILFNE